MRTTNILSALAITGLLFACGKSETKSTDKPATTDKAPASNGDRIAISVTEKGFEPENVSVPSGKPVTLVFTRKTDSTCAKEVVIPLDGNKIEKALPLNEPVAIDVTFPKAGQVTYACGMDMVKGTVVVQ
ncbi:MAG: cupredoxin domain-containing protein [Kofleriaceae bacterium]